MVMSMPIKNKSHVFIFMNYVVELIAIFQQLPVKPSLLFNWWMVENYSNCKGCGHFSPLAPKSFLDTETFENDLCRLNELLHGEIHCFELMGGEALLHPQLEEFIKITAKYVSGEKNLCTNRLLLSKLSDKIYKLCAETGTIICITMYPIDIDWAEINRKANIYGTKLYRIKSAGKSEKKWF